jgi:hypothetical protein
MTGKTEVERRLRMHIPPAVWSEAEREGLVGALEAALDAEEEREALAELRRFFTRRMEPKAKSEGLYSTSALASALAALQARAVSMHLQFVEQGDLLYPLRVLREQYLQGAFIPVEQIPEWLCQHLRDGRPLPTLTLTIAPEAESRVLEAIRSGQPVVLEPCEIVNHQQPLCREFLRYRDTTYAVRYDGALHCLYQAVQDLVWVCGWRECDAVEFALSNRVPDGLPVSVDVEWSLTSGLSFITVRVPLYLKPDEVARIYAQVRRASKHKARYKGISEFTARFVRFVEVYRLQHPNAKWKEILAKWNAQNPDRRVASERESVVRNYNAYIRDIIEQVELEAQSE